MFFQRLILSLLLALLGLVSMTNALPVTRPATGCPPCATDEVCWQDVPSCGTKTQCWLTFRSFVPPEPKCMKWDSAGKAESGPVIPPMLPALRNGDYDETEYGFNAVVRP